MKPTSEFNTTSVGISVSAYRFKFDVPIVILGIGLMMLFGTWLGSSLAMNPEDDSIVQEQQAGDEGGGDDDGKVFNKLSTEDWIRLYNHTFDTNDNWLVLKREHIVTIDSKRNGQLRDDDSEEPSTNSDHDSNDNSTNSDHDSNDNNSVEDLEIGEDGNERYLPKTCLFLGTAIGRNNDSNCIPCLSNVPNNNGSSENNNNIGGTCVICLDDFEVNDMIVWSSSLSTAVDAAATGDERTKGGDYCQHVYHKECMVHYLASHSHRWFMKNHRNLETVVDIENPCPTCRRNFCTVSEQDLAVAIKTKQIENGSMGGSASEEALESAEAQASPVMTT